MKTAHDTADLEEFRRHFPSLNQLRHGKPPVYLDNACTTLVPQPVMDAMQAYYRDFPGCGGRRSHHWFAEEVNTHIDGNADQGIQGSRQIIADFIHAGSAREILFTLNTTHAINEVALGFNFHPGDVVLSTDKEHNSNLIPWLRLQKAGVIRLDQVSANNDGTFNVAAYEQKLKIGRVRLVSMAYTSNLTGCTIPASDIIKIAHQYGARVLLDGAQMVPHQTVNVRELDVDFLAFSLHKMCGPRGLGVLYAKSELLSGSGSIRDHLEPAIVGGGTVDDATYETYRLLGAPEGFEAGIPNYPAQIAAGATIEYLQQIGMDRIAEQELRLNTFLTRKLQDRYGDLGWFQILGPADASLRGGILTFEVHRPNAIGIAAELNRMHNIMIRDGVFCVHSFFNRQYGQGWLRPKSHKDHRMLYRVSPYFYNTIEECRIFAETLHEVFTERGYI